MDFEIILAGDAEYPIINNLARFYMYDMALHAGWPFEADGSFEAGDNFAPYWGRTRANDKRPWPAEWRGFPFLLKADGAPAGFALVAERPPGLDMGEFFIGHQYRRRNLGRRLATAMFDRFAGTWQVREMPTNILAQAFWRRIIADYTGKAFTDTRERFAEYGNADFIVQRFHSGKK